MINQAKNLTLRSPTHAAPAQIISLRPEIFSALRSLAPADLYPTISALTSAALDPAWRQTEHRFAQHKQINYLSMEWLPGPYLDTALETTRLYSPLRGLLGPRLFEETLRYARDLGLGNGGLVASPPALSMPPPTSMCR